MKIVAKEHALEEPDRCKAPSEYILCGTGATCASPVRCGDCFAPVSLYRIQPAEDKLCSWILAWLHAYEACRRLDIQCPTLERAVGRELSRLDSSLVGRGREICLEIEARTGRPTYYCLDSGEAPSSKASCRCPGCAGPWLSIRPWLGLFFLRCEPCRLLAGGTCSS